MKDSIFIVLNSTYFGLFVSNYQARSKTIYKTGNLTNNTLLNKMTETSVIHCLIELFVFISPNCVKCILNYILILCGVNEKMCR